MPSALIKMKVIGKMAGSAGGQGGIFEDTCMCVCVCKRDWVRTIIFSAKGRWRESVWTKKQDICVAVESCVRYVKPSLLVRTLVWNVKWNWKHQMILPFLSGETKWYVIVKCCHKVFGGFVIKGVWPEHRQDNWVQTWVVLTDDSAEPKRLMTRWNRWICKDS